MLRADLKRFHGGDVTPNVPASVPAPAANLGASTTRKKVAFIIAHLGPGGAQRVAVNAANALVDRDVDVHIIEINAKCDAYELDRRVVRYRRSAEAPPRGIADWIGERAKRKETSASLMAVLEALSVTLRALRRSVRLLTGRSEYVKKLRWLRSNIQATKADAILSFLTQTNILVVLATRGMSKRVVISERNDPRLQRHRFRVEFLRRIVYPWADVVTANSKGALESLQFFVPKENLAYLPNPLSTPPSNEIAAFAAPTVITVGRLVEQKGVDVLIAAWAKAALALPTWRLALVGDGPLAGELQEQARKLGVADSIDWIGHVSDPFPYLRGASFFVMTSRFEGTPNALLEAMACGLPAVVSGSSPGPCELIGTGEDAAGLIVSVEDADATAEAIVRLARDESLRKRFGSAARARATVHEADNAMDVWLKLLGCE